MDRRQSLLTAVLVLLSGCATQPLGPRPEPVHLHLGNPERWPLVLEVVDGDAIVPVVDLGTAAAHALELQPGAWRLRASTPHGELLVPVPLVAAALPQGRVLRMSLAPVPAAAFTDPEFAFVPAGPALIGDTLGIGRADERPARMVEIPAFWIGRREVTNAEFAAFLTAVEPAVDPAWCAFDSRKFRIARQADGRWTTEAPDLPVVTVSLSGAQAFCAWRTQATGVRHRLPSEVEWEKAARGPASFVYAYGNVHRPGAANAESGKLRAVGMAAAEGFGTFDMTGNAFEWTSDAWHERTADGRLEATGQQVLRGGSFVLDGMYLRNSFRMRQWPDVRTDDFGFRVVRELP